jgi:hypothetical protein
MPGKPRTTIDDALVQGRSCSICGEASPIMSYAADAAFDAAFRHAGVIRAEGSEEMFDWARALAWCPLPRGPRMAILTNGGGPGALFAQDPHYQWRPDHDLALTPLSLDGPLHPPGKRVLRLQATDLGEFGHPLAIRAEGREDPVALKLSSPFLAEEPLAEDMGNCAIRRAVLVKPLAHGPQHPVATGAHYSDVAVLDGRSQIDED